MAYRKKAVISIAVLFFVMIASGCKERIEEKAESTDTFSEEQITEGSLPESSSAENPDNLSEESRKEQIEIQEPQRSISPTPDREMTQEDKIEDLLEGMTMEEKIAQMFFITPDALTGVSGSQTAGDITKEQFDIYPVGGFAFFDNNIQSPEQITQMNAALAEISRERIGVIPFLGVDEEGGTVLRIADNPSFPQEDVGNMSAVGETGDVSQAYHVGAYLGKYLEEYGFNVDFAPVADIWNNPENTVARERAFGSDAESVAAMVREETRGLQEQNVSAVLKHFPGHGATAADSHTGAAISDKSLEQLRTEEFLPFQSGISQGAEFVMIGHIAVPEVSGDMPASLSHAIITGILREELGFQGIAITDAMNMQAVTNLYPSAEAAVLAIQAGIDMILMPEDFHAAYEGLCSAVYTGKISQDRIDESVMRILRVKLGKENLE